MTPKLDPKFYPRPPKLNLMVRVDLTSEGKRTWKLITELKSRIGAIKKMTPYIAADQTLMNVAGRIPSGPKWGSYQKRLTLGRTPEATGSILSVYAKPKALKDRDIDTQRTVLYVRPKKTLLGHVKKEVLVLARYSPWTSEMLPFTPTQNEGTIVVRKVSLREVKKVTQQRKDDRPQWQTELRDIGIRQIHKVDKPPELKTKYVSDLMFDALRLEFGYGGKAVPHWRPGIKEALLFVTRLYRGRGIFEKAVMNPGFSAWRRWPPRVRSTIKLETVKGFMKFSKRLHVRV